MQVTGESMYIGTGSPIWSGAELDKSDQGQGRTMESTLTIRTLLPVLYYPCTRANRD